MNNTGNIILDNILVIHLPLEILYLTCEYDQMSAFLCIFNTTCAYITPQAVDENEI